MLIFENELMSKHTTMKVGGPVDRMIVVDTEEELREVIDTGSFIIGNGSNVIFGDSGFRGTVIKINFNRIFMRGSDVVAGSGVMLHDLIAYCVYFDRSGPECLAGIPGTVGGIVAMNAGFTRPVSSILRSVKVMNRFGKVSTISKEDMGFFYRGSVVKRDGLVIMEASFRTIPGSIKNEVSRLLDRRRTSQPIYYPSSGSIFKRSGLKNFQGWREGPAEVRGSYIINTGGATAIDVLRLIDRIRKEDTSLELEVEVVGC